MINPVKHAPEKKASPVVRPADQYSGKAKRYLIGFVILGIMALIIYFSLSLPDEIIKNPDGTYSVNPERLAKKEKDYIYGYPELPEYPVVVQLNNIYLIRPPGNKEDN